MPYIITHHICNVPTQSPKPKPSLEESKIVERKLESSTQKPWWFSKVGYLYFANSSEHCYGKTLSLQSETKGLR